MPLAVPPVSFKDHFSDVAAQYASFRPHYPDALFDWLAGQAPARTLAWDCACGSGQAAVPLASRFARVLATDASMAQIEHAESRSNVEYRCAGAEASGLPDDSVDLITVAQALHWFDLPRFYAEAARVLRPMGLLAVWCYGRLRSQDPFLDRALEGFATLTVGPCWPPERALVDEGYRSLPFPWPEIECPAFVMTAQWSIAQLLGYLGTWSATERYRRVHGDDPREALAAELAQRGYEAGREVALAWPLSVRAGCRP